MIVADTSTTFDKAVLAALSAVDVVQTESFLHHTQHFELDPVLGRYPTLTRELLTAGAANFVLDSLRNPLLRHVAIGLEAADVGRNCTLSKFVVTVTFKR